MGTLDFIQKELKIISSFFLKLFDENKFVKSANLLPFSMKLIDQIQKFSHFPILGLFSINFCNNIFISDKFLNFLRNVSGSKTIKIYHTITFT